MNGLNLIWSPTTDLPLLERDLYERNSDYLCPFTFWSFKSQLREVQRSMKFPRDSVGLRPFQLLNGIKEEQVEKGKGQTVLISPSKKN